MTSVSPKPAAPPDVAEVRRITGIANPAIRNLEITQCYSRLAAAVAARSGECSNWCTFATWASRQAGSTIRGEDLLEHLERCLGRERELLHPLASSWRWLLRRGLLQPDSRLGRLTAELHTPFDAFELASDAVARGNKKVFEEIGLEFARYLRECSPEAPPDSAEFGSFLDGLRPGDPPDGQRYLRQAFTRYQRQHFEPNSKTRTELIVLANLEIGLHEQTRLQPEIREALDSAYVTEQELGTRLLHLLLPRAARWRRPVHRPAAAAVGALATRVQRVSSEVAREAITRSFMVLSLPGRVLALGLNLDDAYPEPLRELSDPELIELLERFEPVPPAPDDCGARDWSDLEQRMHYIAHLFRVFHAHRDLFDPPFTPEQVRSFSRGVLPEGAL